MGRRHNAKCDVCGKTYYRRPSQVSKYGNGYCSMACYGKAKFKPPKICEMCGIEFRSKYKRQRFCSRRCATIKTRRGWSTKKKYDSFRNQNEGRLYILKHKFSFDSCMVVGCDYNKTYDIHRLIPGKYGGKYVIGNMFAICPNHHAEIHRKLVSVKKISDCELVVEDINREEEK